MLHNTGAYGPNDATHSANTPVNMTQVTGPLNTGRNLQNMGDLTQPPLRGPTGHYNLPNYSPYHYPGLDMRPNLDNFSKGFQYPYMSPNPNSALNRWQNGMTPLNLNAQSTYVPNTHNFHPSFDKTQPNSMNFPIDMKDPKLVEEKTVPESVPKSGVDGNYFYNTHQDVFTNYNHNYSQSVPKELSQMDVSKRRSIENTVKLIENILINTTKDNQHATKHSTEMYDYMSKDLQSTSENKDLKLDPKLNLEYKPKKIDNKTENSDKEMTEIDEKPEDFKEISLEVEKTEHIITKPDIPTQINNDNSTQQSEEESTKELKPTMIKDVKIKIEVDILATNEDDDDYNLDFCKDINGISREEVDEKVTISQNSIMEATEAAKNGTTSANCYYECPYCRLLFSHTKRFLIHTKWHTFGLTNEKRILMAREREFQKKQRKEAKIVDQIHKTIEEDGVTYHCKDCPKIFCTKGSLKNHRARFHSGRVRECGICGAVAMGWAGMKAHAATHTSPFQCPVCDKVFRHKHSLQRHAETHIAGLKAHAATHTSLFQCSVCDKVFWHKHSLQRFAETHIEEQDKTHRCEQCGKMFAVLTRFKEHMRNHARAERGATYQCSYCAKSFVQAYSLTIHERTHRNEKPYSCDICTSSYGTNSSLKRHMKVSHNQDKPFVCSQCLRCFISAKALHRHIVRVHADGSDPEFKKRRRRPKDPLKHVPKEPKAKKPKAETEILPEAIEEQLQVPT